MTARVLPGAVVALLLSFQVLAQSPSAFPVDITVARPPQPVAADGRTRLLYELHLTSFSPVAIELTGLDVLGLDGASPLARYRGEALEKLLIGVGPTDSAGKPRTIVGRLRILLDGSPVVRPRFSTATSTRAAFRPFSCRLPRKPELQRWRGDGFR